MKSNYANAAACAVLAFDMLDLLNINQYLSLLTAATGLAPPAACNFRS